MIIKNKFLDERKLEIYEEDLVNDTEILVLVVYCVRRDDSAIWEMPSPQIFNSSLYAKYKDKYDEQVTAFRNDCSGVSDASLIENRFLVLEEEMEIMQTAFDEFLLSGLALE
jgi:hypothetical protein